MALYTLVGNLSLYKCSALLPVCVVRVEGRTELPGDEMGSGF